MAHSSTGIKERILICLAVFLLVIARAAFISEAGSGDGGSGVTVLAFTSDIHNSENNTAARRLDLWLDKVRARYGHIDLMSFCGDMGAAQANEEQFWTYTSSVMKVVKEENGGIPGVYTTGNHEFYNGKFGTTENGVAGIYKKNEEGVNKDDYRIYCLGTDNWDNRRDIYTDEQISKLQTYLNSVGNDKPIIILTHFPLHSTSGGMMKRQTTNADRVIDILNNAADGENGKKIVLLWGHNHTVKDVYYDQIYAPGDKIEYDGSLRELNFYYGAAGCMSDSEYGTGSAFVKGKGLVITIDENSKLTFTYFDANGRNVTEGGTYSEIPVHATDLVIDESVEEGADGQPVKVGQTIKAGKKLQLHLTVTPDDAGRRGLVWSSSDETVATVSDNGIVKGISGGKAVIAAAIPGADGEPALSADIEITVSPRTSAVYVLTDRLEPGKDYIIANSNTGSAYVLANNDGAAAIKEITIDGDRIVTDDETIIFTAEGGSDSDDTAGTVTGISNNDEYYLNAGRGGPGGSGGIAGSLSFSDSAQRNRPWSYGDDRILMCSGSRGNYYLYFDSDSNAFSAGSVDADAAPPEGSELYLFVRTEISPEPEPEPEPEPQPEKKTAVITYSLGGGSYRGSTADITETYNVGDVITVHEAPEREGYTFSYWKGSKYKPGDSYTVTGDHTFTAVWTADSEGSGGKEDGSGTGGSAKSSKGRPGTGDSGSGLSLLLFFGSVMALAAMLAARRARS